MERTNNTPCKIDDVTDYVISRFVDEPNRLSLLKLQKLLFYVQAWRLALRSEPLFSGKFQAWVHGPVNRQIYDRFKDTHSLYACVGPQDVRKDFDVAALSDDQRAHINEILEAYGAFTGPQLEDMTHDETPWIAARGELRPHERCETDISEDLMQSYYHSLLSAEKEQ